MELEELKEAVVKKLISDHNMLIEEAEETVDNSVKDNGSMWNENADPDRLAKFLDSDEDDE